MDGQPSAADSTAACSAALRSHTPEVETAQFRPRDRWTPLLAILAIALAFLLGWMLGLVTVLGLHTQKDNRYGSQQSQIRPTRNPRRPGKPTRILRRQSAQSSCSPKYPPTIRWYIKTEDRVIASIEHNDRPRPTLAMGSGKRQVCAKRLIKYFS
jgi:hypothetical protein